MESDGTAGSDDVNEIRIKLVDTLAELENTKRELKEAKEQLKESIAGEFPCE